MIKIDLNELRKNDANILRIILDKVKNDDYIITENDNKIKVVSCGFDDFSGEELITFYDYEDDLKIADMIVDETIGYLNRNTQKITNITLKTWFYYWLNKFTDNYSEISKKGLEQRFLYNILPALGDIKLQEYQNSDFSKLLKNCNNKATGTKRSTMCYFRSLINTAVRLELLPEEKEVVYTLSYKRSDRFNYFTDSELDLIMPDILDSRFSVLYLLSLATGMPVNRIVALRKSDINEEKQEIVSSKGTNVIITSLGVYRRVIVEMGEKKYHPHIDIIKALLELMDKDHTCEYFFFDYYDLLNDLVIIKDLKKILHKNKIKGAGKNKLALTAERIAIEKGMHHVDFKYTFGYSDYKYIMYKYEAMHKKGRRQKEAEKRFIKLIDNIKKGIQK